MYLLSVFVDVKLSYDRRTESPKQIAPTTEDSGGKASIIIFAPCWIRAQLRYLMLHGHLRLYF